MADSQSNDVRPNLIFSVDVEDWAQSTIDTSLPIGEHCAANARALLALLDEVPGATGTFFILGKFAEKHPDVVREMNAAGHDIASHGYGHVQVHLLDPPSFREDLRRAKGLLADIVGVDVCGYRAPVFSIGAKNLWALNILAEEEVRYDSSVFPINGTRYGIANWPRETSEVRLDKGQSIIEFPLTAKTIRGRNFPISGGGYARLLPGWLLCKLLAHEARTRRTWPVFYCHPYEIDPHEFRAKNPTRPWGNRRLPLKLRLHQGLGRGGFARKLRLLMRSFRFRSFADAMKQSSPFEEIRASDYTTENHP